VQTPVLAEDQIYCGKFGSGQVKMWKYDRLSWFGRSPAFGGQGLRQSSRPTRGCNAIRREPTGRLDGNEM